MQTFIYFIVLSIDQLGYCENKQTEISSFRYKVGRSFMKWWGLMWHASGQRKKDGIYVKGGKSESFTENVMLAGQKDK